MRVFIVNGTREYDTLFKSIGHQVVHSLENADLICFTGGADVSPILYGDKAHMHTYSDLFRDEHEKIFFAHSQELEIPAVGICRGGQFLNVMSGGRMYQHVEGHTQSHYMTDLETGETIYVSSTHHQMMMPSADGILIAASHQEGERQWFDGDKFRKDVSTEDIEVVYYPHTNCLCFQPHPEFQQAEFVAMCEYFKSLIERLFVGVEA
jgi:gamma-glutamyl-gamma-aminobutyrate hydrolase PuuD